MLKVYERIMENRVREILNKQLEESQSGFRKGRSCQDHIITLKQIPGKIRAHDQKNLHGFRRQLKAFDSVPRRQIWQHLRKRGCSRYLHRNALCLRHMCRNALVSPKFVEACCAVVS